MQSLRSMLAAIPLVAVLLNPAHAEGAKITIETQETGQLNGKIIAVEPGQRLVKIKGPRGNVLALKLGDAALNFGKLQVGQAVSAEYILDEKIAVVTASAKTPDAQEKMVLGGAPRGQTPAGYIDHTVEFTTEVVDIDLKARTATLRLPEGDTFTVNVKSDVPLEQAKAGDKVVYASRLAMKLKVE